MWLCKNCGQEIYWNESSVLDEYGYPQIAFDGEYQCRGCGYGCADSDALAEIAHWEDN